MFCKADSLQLLLYAGANPTLNTVEGDTIFSLAERINNRPTIEILQRYNSNIEK